MKTSLDHLPEAKQAEIRRIVEVILEVMSPEKIILFGSYAKGTYVEHRYQTSDGTDNEYVSDYDILIVTTSHQEKVHVQEGMIMDRVSRYRPPVNLEIHDLEYINKGLEDGEYFFVDIVNEGVVLFDRNENPFSAPLKLSNQQKKLKAERYFNTWFPQASEFIFGCEAFMVRGNLKTAVFMLHQAAESLYYATLLVFTDYKPKSHNLWKLRKKSKPFSRELFEVFKTETSKADELLFELLKKGYVDARYRSDYNITEIELTELIHRVKKMVQLTEIICSEKIRSLG